MKGQHFDTVAFALVDFERQQFESFVLQGGGVPAEPVYFDLASLTKPLTLSALFHRRPDLFSDSDHLLHNHRGGLPPWGVLSRSHWKENLLGYPVGASPVCYSDYSALRLMLELEKKSDQTFKEMCSFYWDPEMLFWRDLPAGVNCPATGRRQGCNIVGEVNDANGWNLGVFCSHAGLFATVEGLARSLLNLDRGTQFLETMNKAFDSFEPQERFLHGWDTPSRGDSLAGEGHGPHTFGHLGFTGTSIWIDPGRKGGQILLTNGCHPWQHARGGLGHLRRKMGQEGWQRLNLKTD